jgi:hypothetical protein
LQLAGSGTSLDMPVTSGQLLAVTRSDRMPGACATEERSLTM